MILVVCVCVCDGSGMFWGGTRLVMCNHHTYCTLYCLCMITSGCNRGAASEADAIGE